MTSRQQRDRVAKEARDDGVKFSLAKHKAGVGREPEGAAFGKFRLAKEDFSQIKHVLPDHPLGDGVFALTEVCQNQQAFALMNAGENRAQSHCGCRLLPIHRRTNQARPCAARSARAGFGRPAGHSTGIKALRVADRIGGRAVDPTAVIFVLGSSR